MKIHVEGYGQLYIQCDDNPQYTEIKIPFSFKDTIDFFLCIELLDNCSSVFFISPGYEIMVYSVEWKKTCKSKYIVWPLIGPQKKV